MTNAEFQEWLNTHGQQVEVDDIIGPKSREATIAAFTNLCAEAVTGGDITILSARLGVSEKQMRAVAQVESSGGGFDSKGRPKILFERHKFHSATGGKYSTTSYSNSKSGGYNEDSWEKLTLAIGKDVDAAFASASWGKFQVMGFHWEALGYPSALEMAYTSVVNEAAHYEMLVRYVEEFGLSEEMAMISTDEDDCRPFAKGYNGSGYEKYGYHTKLAAAMA